jgi:hypothetical protein
MNLLKLIFKDNILEKTIVKLNEINYNICFLDKSSHEISPSAEIGKY